MDTHSHMNKRRLKCETTRLILWHTAFYFQCKDFTGRRQEESGGIQSA